MDAESVACPYNGRSLSLQKERSVPTRAATDEP